MFEYFKAWKRIGKGKGMDTLIFLASLNSQRFASRSRVAACPLQYMKRNFSPFCSGVRAEIKALAPARGKSMLTLLAVSRSGKREGMPPRVLNYRQ